MPQARQLGAGDSGSIQLVELVARDRVAQGETPIEVTVGGHVTLRVRRGFDAETLRRLLAVLESEGGSAGC